MLGRLCGAEVGMGHVDVSRFPAEGGLRHAGSWDGNSLFVQVSEKKKKEMDDSSSQQW